jgi:hypothetical protein
MVPRFGRPTKVVRDGGLFSDQADKSRVDASLPAFAVLFEMGDNFPIQHDGDALFAIGFGQGRAAARGLLEEIVAQFSNFAIFVNP